nr:serine/threonine protein kinase [Gemmatimonadota bacterium]
LVTRCAGDPHLLAEVLALLEEDARGSSMLDRELGRVAHEVLDGSVPVLRAIGPYRILQVLGQGGMGVVYLAEREDLGNRVAIKVLRDASLSPARRERFAREEQTLAQLNHPSIARLYDADTLPDGTPYFVMEYVEGMPLTAYCAAHRCSIAERLRLFRVVCEAVQHAHRQAVVHRDLKPSNILVTEGRRAGEAAVKLLDFGIAKRLESLDAPADQTQTMLRLMTPAYAAPEQLRGEPVGTYTDIYALGVILYELLTGEHPFDLAGLTPGQIEARILETEPEKPSSRVRRAAGKSAAPAGLASVGAAAWAELDVLCLTTMHKDPQRRYPTVEALLRDLDHYLKGEPLEARPDSWRYRTGKFLHRNRQPLAAAALVVALIIGLVGFYTLQLREARDTALAEAARTERIQRFMLQLFEGGGGPAGPADSLRAVTLLHRGVQEARLLDSEPEVQAELYHTLGTLFQELGDFAQADSLLQAALDKRRSLFGPDHPEIARNLVALGLLRADQGELQEAERLVREAVDRTRRSLLPQHPAVAEALTALGKVLQQRGEYQPAIELLEEAVRLRAAHGPTSIELSESLGQLANTHFYAGNYAVSDSLNRLLLVMDRRLYGPRHPSVADALINLGASRLQLGFYEEAEQLYRQALEIMLGHYGPDHHETASNMMMLGQALTYQDRYEEALQLLRPALAVRERVYGADHPRVANTLNEPGSVALKQGDFATAERYFRRMAEIYRKAYDDKHYLIGVALANLASVYMDGEQYGRAEPIFREAIARFTETLSADHIHTAIARIKLGRVLVRQGRHREAEGHLLAGHNTLAAQAKPSVNWLRKAREDLVMVYQALGESQKAAQFQGELAAAREGTPSP